MGIVRMGPPEKLTEYLRRYFGLRNFVETGTFRGNTTVWAAERFAHVYTAERSDIIFQSTSQRLAAYANVTFRHCDSRSLVRELVDRLPPALFWLDAHWCGGDTAGTDDECPVMDELAALAPHLDRHFVMIDDARLFLSPPPPPHKPDQWPSVDQIIRAAAAQYPIFDTVVDDVILLAPNWARAAVANHLKDAGA